jgi:PIN domain nuclease of toxin-antitoxin system
MRFLLDTHLRLRALNNPERPGAAARDAIEDPANDILFGTAGIWEVAIKTRLGRPAFAVRAETIAREALARGFAELLIRWQSASIVILSIAYSWRKPSPSLSTFTPWIESLRLTRRLWCWPERHGSQRTNGVQAWPPTLLTSSPT